MSTHMACLTTTKDGVLRTCNYFPIEIEDGKKVRIAINAVNFDSPHEQAMPFTVVVVE